jgi:hypothetical protein
MLPEDKHLQTLLRHKHIYDLFARTNEIVGLTPEVRGEITNAYRQIHDAHYHYNDGCHTCIVEMLVTIYSWYNKEIKK